MSGLTRKFLLAFSHCAFYSILNPFSFPLSFIYLGGHCVPWHYGFICCHRLLQSHLDIPRKVPVTLDRCMTTKGDAINYISAQFAIICLDPELFSGLAG